MLLALSIARLSGERRSSRDPEPPQQTRQACTPRRLGERLGPAVAAETRRDQAGHFCADASPAGPQPQNYFCARLIG
jgi:hypothetical protein